MNREALTKVFMVTVLLGALGLTMKLAIDAQDAEQTRRTSGTGGVDSARKLEIQQTIRKAIHAHRQLDYEAAQRILEEASERYPDVAAVWLNLGICYGSLDKLDAADRAFARVLEINPKDWDAVAERATLELRRGHTDEAFAMIEAVPANKGQVYERLRSDPAWVEVRKHERMPALLEKHGVVTDGETGLRQVERVIKARAEQRGASEAGDEPPSTSTSEE